MSPIPPPSFLFFKSIFHVRRRLLSFTSSMLHLVWSRERNDKTLTPTPTGIFLMTASDWEFCATILSSQPILKFFDPTKPVNLQVDASKSGLGACVLQDRHPIAYASRSLTQAEENYSQIEKELFAVVFVCERFNHYAYGRPVDVYSDHKPLVPITKKPL